MTAHTTHKPTQAPALCAALRCSRFLPCCFFSLVRVVSQRTANLKSVSMRSTVEVRSTERLHAIGPLARTARTNKMARLLYIHIEYDVEIEGGISLLEKYLHC